ncbi:AMP deaminase [Rosa chinensis]|uniref:AMP deaminase n=1 Tax=Rosa chinensis TaxID=74649 RepID=UPI000D08B5B9|nr:AMP deaminase [Rosa chinensis]
MVSSVQSKFKIQGYSDVVNSDKDRLRIFRPCIRMAEYRISIYGRKQSEWDQMASWIVNNELYSENVLPRLYNIYKEMGIVISFQNILDNIFIPLFEVTINPDSHPQLHVFLKQTPNIQFQALIYYLTDLSE